MAPWALTAGLQNLRRQVDAVFPDRDRRSDGTIGDTAHQSRTSGHNRDDTPGSKPAWDGDADRAAEVRAWDCDHDLGPGVDAQDLVDKVRKLPGVGTVIRYIIYRGKIYHSRNGFLPEDYEGSNPHNEHIHFEGAWTQSGDNNTTFDFHLEDLVALTEKDKEWISAEIRKVVTGDADPGPREYSLGGLVTSIERRTEDDDRRADALGAKVDGLADQLVEIKALIAQSPAK